MEMSTEDNGCEENIATGPCCNSTMKQQSVEKVPWQDVEPITISEEDYEEIFGNSSDEETEFYGFSEKELGLKEFRNVMSPNKLKFQDDFYMPLFLSHRKRNRDIALSKSEESHVEIDRSVEIRDSEEMPIYTEKDLNEDSDKGHHESSKAEYSNPYAKQYKSYRRDRTRSLPQTSSKSYKAIANENCNNDRSSQKCSSSELQLDANDEKRDNQPDLKMKIHYESHVRPKRKVTVQEKDDYVYEITLPSKKRAHVSSPTVITNATILADGKDSSDQSLYAEETFVKDEFLENEENLKESKNGNCLSVLLTDIRKPVQEETAQEETVQQADEKVPRKREEASKAKGKGKKRFKNFRGVETSYPKATLDDIISLKREEEVRNTDGYSSKAAPKQSMGISKTAPGDKASKPDRGCDDEKRLRKPNSSGDVSITAEEERENDAETPCRVGLKSDSEEASSNISLSTKTSREQNRRSLRKTRWGKEDDPAVASGNVTETDGNNVDLKENGKECRERAMGKELRRKEKAGAFKPKDINLTDSWFIAANKTNKKAETETKDVRKGNLAASNPKNEEQSETSKGPILGSAVPVDGKKSLSTTRKRRLKNVTVEQNHIENESGVNAELSKDSAKESATEAQPSRIGRIRSKRDASDTERPFIDGLNERAALGLYGAEEDRKINDERSNSKTGLRATRAACKTAVVEINPDECVANRKTKYHSSVRRVGRYTDDSNLEGKQETLNLKQDLVEDEKEGDIKDGDASKSASLRPRQANHEKKREFGERICHSNDGMEQFCAPKYASERLVMNRNFGSRGEKEPRRKTTAGIFCEEDDFEASTDRTAEPDIDFSTPVEMIENSLSNMPPKSIYDHALKNHEGEQGFEDQDDWSAEAKSPSNEASVRQLEMRFSGDRRDLRERGIIDLTKISRKINRRFSKSEDKEAKASKSGKSFIIKTPVDDTERQVTMTPKKPKVRRNSKGFYDGESDTDIDITAVGKEEEPEKGNDFNEAKVKRKVYTVVRKIRRTEINADGKKVTKIIKQIVKKVCPVTSLSSNNLTDASRRVITEKQVTDHESTRVESSKADGSNYIKTKVALNQNCGKCTGCIRKEDCKICDSCRKKEKALPQKISVICRMRQCTEKGRQKAAKETKGERSIEKGKKQVAKTKAVLPSREEMTVKSLTKLKQYDSKKDETSLSTSSKGTSLKAKLKGRGSRIGLKDSMDDVYAPGFRLRSKKAEVVKTKPNRILKQVKYSGMEPKVKLPWPEEQDEQSMCSSGSFFCVTSPIDIAAKDVCFHCGSGGFSKMITCINCSEMYHEFCIEIDPLDDNKWHCDRCKRCNVCGYKDNLLMCDKCHDCYHAECLGPFYHKETEGIDDCWVCAKCVKCEKCGAKVPGKKRESKWMSDFTLCEECHRKIERGQYCLICRDIYSEDDYDTKMMYCSACCKWIHMECEGLNIDEYECLAELPEEIPYVCKICHASEIWPKWYQEVREEIQAGFEKAYYEILASSDIKIVKKHLPEFKDSEAEHQLEETLTKIQRHEFTTVEQFFESMKKFIEILSKMIAGVLPDQIISDLKLLLKKQIKLMFPWTEALLKTKAKEPEMRPPSINATACNKREVPDHVLSAVSLDHTYNTEIGEVEKLVIKNEEEFSQLKDTDGAARVDDEVICDNVFDKLICREKSFSASPEEYRIDGINATPFERICMTSKEAASLDVGEGNGKFFVQADRRDDDAGSEVASEKHDSNGNDVDVACSSKGSVYDDETSQDSESACLEGKIRTAKHIDDRRCLLCSQYGDEIEQESGRILNAGPNEWVHVNCALWSAEVYENDLGLLQNVHIAISRGQKLQCSSCQQWGATVGCCTPSCPSNYHFMCARSTAVIFQNDKLVFCPKHKSRSKSEVILNDDGFVVARPVMVDLSKVSNQKKFAVDRDPDSISIFSGSMVIYRLGRLTESSNGEEFLLPIGYRATRLFWSSTDTSKRCKYFFSVDEIPLATKNMKEKEDVFMGGVTIPYIVDSVKRKNMSTEEGNKQPDMKRPKLIEVVTPPAAYLKVTKTSVIPKPTDNPSHNVPSLPLENTPSKVGKESCFKSLLTQWKSTVNSQTIVNPSTDPPFAIGSSVSERTPCRPSQAASKATAPFYHKSSPHKIIPQPGGPFNVYDLSNSNANRIAPKPRLIQPKLRYEVVPTVLQPDVSGCNTKRPILPKYDPPVVAIARHLQCHLTSNPQMLNYVGDTTLQGLSQVLGTAYSFPASHLPLSNVNSNGQFMPCYTLNLPDAFWSMHSMHTHEGSTSHPFQGQKAPCIVSKRPKSDSSCQTDGRAESQIENSTHDVPTDSSAQQVITDSNTWENIERHVNTELDKDNGTMPTCMLQSDLSFEAPDKCGDRCVTISDRIDTSVDQDTRGASIVDVEAKGRSSPGTALPDIREFFGKQAVTSQLKRARELGLCGDSGKEFSETSPLSLENLPDLSCLQAAAQLAKLMPEMFSGDKSMARCSESAQTHKGRTQVSEQERLDGVDSLSSSSLPSPQNNCGGLDSRSESKKNRKWYQKRMKKLLDNGRQSKSRLRVTVKSEDGLVLTGISVQGVWKQLVEKLNDTRIDQKQPPLLFNELEAFDFFGLTKFPTLYLAEQLPGGHKCRNYKFQYHLPCTAEEDKELPINPHGCARAETCPRKPPTDMFAWLASPYRTLPQCVDEGENDNETNKTATDLPLSMRFRQLKNKVKDHVGVYRSMIDGRGLFCKRQIEPSEMVIEYAGSVIRATLTDKRENYYEGKGYGCYMFRIDDTFVVDATLFGNEARFINHSCEPNCYSRIVPVDGEKHIVIFASRRIYPGEELTYDYKFPFEEEKLPCHCGSKKCRKYLN